MAQENINEELNEEKKEKLNNETSADAKTETGTSDTEAKAEETGTEPDSQKTEEEELRDKLDKATKEYLYLRAEFDNFKKRTIREKADIIKSASATVLGNILPLIDNFERGIEAAEKTQDMNAVKQGMELIYKQFQTFLTQNGVKEIDTKDQTFDTDFHEAVTMIPSPTPEQKGKVIDCIQKGYMLGDKVIRFAKVVVGQ